MVSSAPHPLSTIPHPSSLQELEALLVVPAHGYSSLEEYYEDVSGHDYLKDVRSPLICICSRFEGTETPTWGTPVTPD